MSSLLYLGESRRWLQKSSSAISFRRGQPNRILMKTLDTPRSSKCDTIVAYDKETSEIVPEKPAKPQAKGSERGNCKGGGLLPRAGLLSSV